MGKGGYVAQDAGAAAPSLLGVVDWHTWALAGTILRLRVPLDALVRRVASAHRTPVVLDPEFRSACEALLSLVMLTHGLVRPAQAHMERTHERLCARITLPTFESDEVPAKRLGGVVFEMCDIVSRHGRVIVIERGIPC